MSTELKVFFEIFFNTINEINENKTNIPLRNSELAITRNLYFDILMGITNELRNNQETINESNNFQNNIVNEFQTVQNSPAITPFLTNSINMIMGFSTKSKEVISDYLDIILADSFKINNSSNRTRLYFRKIQLEIFLRWKKTTSNDYNEDIMEFNNLVSKYQVNYSNYIDLFQIISLLCNINNDSILEIILFYEKLLKKYEKYDKLKNKLSSKKEEIKKEESWKEDLDPVFCCKEMIPIPIPVSFKKTLWSLHFPNVLEGKCKCCQTETITRNNFECGHIISKRNGGEIKLENLKPICRACNSSMDVMNMNMNDYMKKYGFDKISNFKKDESKKDESKKDESKKNESKKDESKKDESKKDESKKDESKKDESKKEEKKVKKPKEKIPVSVKNTLWSLHFPNVLEGKCKCCQTETITRNNFDCGHIISEKEGGEIKLENLKPICRACNSSMGVMNMNEYMKKYGFDKIANKKMVI